MTEPKAGKMAKRSSYRLSGRLSASRKSRLAYITYLNSGADKKPKADGGGGPVDPPEPSAAHRYWRIQADKVNFEFGWDIRRLALYEAGGVLNETNNRRVDGAVTASSTYSGFPEPQVLFSSETTRWASDFTGIWPQTLTVDYGAGNDKAIVALSTDAGEAFGRQMSEGSISYSDDGVNYTLFKSWANVAPGARVWYFDERAAGHRYWRLLYTGSWSTGSERYINCAELKFYSEPGGEPYAVTGPFASGQYNGSVGADKAFDGIPSSRHIMSYYGDEAFLGADLTSAIVNSFSFTRDAQLFVPGEYPNGAIVQFSDDLTTWSDYWTTAMANDGPGSTTIYTKE